jgi:4-amino-4-deoxy-L-arabinose transferase-like glycosyltransferase
MSLAIDRPSSAQPGALAQAPSLFRRWETGAIGAILALAAFLNLFNLSKEGYANTYYSAAIRSMLQSWHNFFFVSFDPGGFVSVDKPPLGFWIQTLSAKLLGFHGWSILLPQALAGVASVFVLFMLVRRAFGSIAGLIAAAALAVTPVAVADNRNNTIDSLLVLCLLLAAWAVLKATDRGSLRWLLLGMALVGLGFNIKMLEAYLALPGLVALYFFGAPLRWRTRFLHLALGGIVLLAISLSWVVGVDLTPASQRPYVGSSQHNSELELAFGYNGLQRLIGMGRPARPRSAQTRPTATAAQSASASARVASTGAAGPATGLPNPGAPGSAGTGGNAQFRPPQGGPGGFVEGGPSLLRLFDTQLGGQASWLLPLALIGLMAAAVATIKRMPRSVYLRSLLDFRLSGKQQQLILWAVWLLVVVAFFSIANFFHPYYLVTLAPAVAALAGIGAVELWRSAWRPGWLGWLMPLAILVTAGAQVYLLHAYPDWSGRIVPVLLGLSIAGAAFVVIARLRPRLPARVLTAAVMLGLAGLFLTPVVWSGITMAQSSGGGMPSGGPNSFGPFGRPQTARSARDGSAAATFAPPPGTTAPGAFDPQAGGPLPGPLGFDQNPASQSKLTSYLEANRGDTRFMLAVPSSMSAAPIIIQTGQPVMAMGGFSGGDPILTADQLAQDVKDGLVRFFLLQGARRSAGENPAVATASSDGRTEAITSPGAGNVPPPFTGSAAQLLPPPVAPGDGAGNPGFAFPGPGGPGGFGATGEAENWVTANCSVVPPSDWEEANSTASSRLGFFGGQQLYDCSNVAGAS